MITTSPRLVNNWEQAVRTHLVDKLWDFYAREQIKMIDLSYNQYILSLYIYSWGVTDETTACPLLKMCLSDQMIML
jgi:hypothetical protein